MKIVADPHSSLTARSPVQILPYFTSRLPTEVKDKWSDSKEVDTQYKQDGCCDAKTARETERSVAKTVKASSMLMCHVAAAWLALSGGVWPRPSRVFEISQREKSTNCLGNEMIPVCFPRRPSQWNAMQTTAFLQMKVGHFLVGLGRLTSGKTL